MSRRRHLITAAPVALMILGLVAAPASAAPDHRERIVQPVTATFTAMVPTARGFDATAAVSARGREVATQDLSCTGSGVPGTALACDFVLTYDDGTVAGTIASPAGSRKIDGTIDDGTGRYQGAVGAVFGRATDSGAKVVVRITLPDDV